MTDPARLHPDDLAALIEATARRVIELQHEHEHARRRFLTVGEVAARLSVSPEWVRDNADRLGVIRLGDGPRPRLRFDPDAVADTLRQSGTGRANRVTTPSSARSGAEPKPQRTTVATAGIALDRLPVRELEPRPQTRNGPGDVAASRGLATRGVSPPQGQPTAGPPTRREGVRARPSSASRPDRKE